MIFIHPYEGVTMQKTFCDECQEEVSAPLSGTTFRRMSYFINVRITKPDRGGVLTPELCESCLLKMVLDAISDCRCLMRPGLVRKPSDAIAAESLDVKA